MKKVLIIGLGISGRSAAEFLHKKGFQITAVDRQAKELSENAALRAYTIFPEDAPLDFKEFEFVVVSPGIPQEHPLYQKALEAGKEIIGEIELAGRYIKQPVLGVTGTNGKTTVTLLVAHVLNASGKVAHALGNVGVPLTKEVKEGIIVAELSSYQLETLRSTFLDAGVILNITPDHLDRYKSLDEYAKAKIGMKNNLKPGAPLWVESKSAGSFNHLVSVTHTYGYANEPIYTDLVHVYTPTGDFELPQHLQGKRSHDVENLMAAYALCSTQGITAEQFLKGYMTFQKPHHRIEFVRELNGVSYYDDSKGTNIDAVMRAVEALRGKVVLIAGGVDKGAAYTPWIESFGGKVKCVCAIGEAAQKLKAQLEPHIQVRLFSNLESAILDASKLAQPGENILLSPGCSSFDMFRDYAHRGQEFQRLVRAL